MKEASLQKFTKMARLLKWIPFFTLLFVAGFFNACNKIDASEGAILEREFEVDDFDKISIETAGILNYTQSTERFVGISANEEILDILHVEVVENTLVIRFSQDKTILNEEHLIFTVSDDDVFSIETKSSANVNANFDEGYNFYELEMISTGAGNIQLDAANCTNGTFSALGPGDIEVTTINAAGVDAVLGGSGDVIIHGSASTLDLTITGAGNYADHDFIAEKVDAFLSGSGNARVSVSYQLNANLTGSGNLTFKGSPTINASSSTGSGVVIDGN